MSTPASSTISRKRRPTCTDPTHEKNPRGGCLTCKRSSDREYKLRPHLAAGEVAVLPAGKSVYTAARIRAWQTRREKYGPSGIPPQKMQDHIRGSQRGGKTTARKRRYCKNGHLLTPATAKVYIHKTKGPHRVCLLCVKMRRAPQRKRPEWVTVAGVRHNVAVHDTWVIEQGRKLWAALLEAHPDRGGTDRKFRIAHRAWTRFYDEQVAWYQRVNLPMPEGIKRG